MFLTWSNPHKPTGDTTKSPWLCQMWTSVGRWWERGRLCLKESKILPIGLKCCLLFIVLQRNHSSVADFYSPGTKRTTVEQSRMTFHLAAQARYSCTDMGGGSLGHSQLRAEVNEGVHKSWACVILLQLMSLWVFMSTFLSQKFPCSACCPRAATRPKHSLTLWTVCAWKVWLQEDIFFSDWTEIKPLLLESKSPNFVVTVNWQEGRLFMALLQWDRTQAYQVRP